MRRFAAHWLGRVPYASAHALQERLLHARFRGEVGDTLLLLEHEPVITLGRGARGDNVVADRSELARRGIEVHETGRGGDVTYHGPGQLVAYPIFDLRPDRCDVRRYVRDLARVMILLASEFGVDAAFIDGAPKLVGVWVDEASPARWPGDPRHEGGATRAAKIGAIGVRLSRWVTMHGFAFNLSTDLSAFRWIVPCGIAEYGVTSLVKVAGSTPTVERAALHVVSHFEHVFAAEGTVARHGAAWELSA
ncbi:MAG TPA: lipoyl(octanoyl) transferase LipB [Polyangiaceae bacterium]|nr:lipoyl(octanoyl) transferase LipB [Polyangiaceae bacterium]